MSSKFLVDVEVKIGSCSRDFFWFFFHEVTLGESLSELWVEVKKKIFPYWKKNPTRENRKRYLNVRLELCFCQDVRHLLLHFLCCVSCSLSELFATIGIDDGSAGVHQQTTVFIHTILAYVFQRTSLGTYTRNQGGKCSGTMRRMSSKSLPWVAPTTYISWSAFAPLLTGYEALFQKDVRHARQWWVGNRGYLCWKWGPKE